MAGRQDSAKDKEDSVSKLSTKQIVSWFIASNYTSGGFTSERINNSIALLKRVPASRHAVLQRFTQLFEESVRYCFDHRARDYNGSSHSASQELIASTRIVSTTLNELLEKNGQAWGLILCEWSIESLRQISSTFKMGGSMSGSSINSGSRLNETVSNWMQVFPARNLMNLYRSCLKLLIDQGNESCMDSLLAASVQHSPNFDWVVANVGNTFPQEITNRVIKSGFRDFVAQQWGDESMDDGQSKMKSIVHILEHLSNRHSNTVQKSIIDLYQSSTTVGDKMQVKAMLYIMQLLSDSPLLVKITTKPFIDILDSNCVNNLYRDFRKLPDHRNKLDAVSSLAVHLICQSSVGSFSLIKFILKASSDNSLERPLQDIFSEIMTLLLKDLLRIAMRKRANGEKKENGVVVELKKNYAELCDEFLKTTNVGRRNWITTLLKIVSIKGCGCLVLYKLLCGITDLNDIILFLGLYSFISATIPGILEQVVEYCFAVISSEGIRLHRLNNFIKNIWRLLLRKVDAPGSYELQSRLHKVLWDHVTDLQAIIPSVNPDQPASSLAVDIFASLVASPVAPVLETSQFSLSITLVAHFFKLLHCGRVNNDQSMISCRHALVQLSQAPETFTIVCQSVLESSVTQANATLFGRRTESIKEDEDGAPTLNHLLTEQRVSLLSQHRTYMASTSVVSYVPVVVETGIVGSGPKKKKSCPLSKSAQVTNNECISLLIHRCCCKTGSGSSMEGGVIHDIPASFDEEKLMILSRKLLDAITSSVQGALLHSETKWPDSQFRKYTVERDLRIFAFFDEHPFAWSIMDLLANSAKALWRCSMLIRAMTGALLHHWESSREDSTLTSDCYLRHSIKIIEVLEKSQMLPEPLCFVSELFSLLAPYEVFLILNDVWKFIHAHPLPDTPAYSSRRKDFAEGTSLQPYLLTIHSILHANIKKMGHLYARFVPSKSS